jgi:hypothetical protein
LGDCLIDVLGGTFLFLDLVWTAIHPFLTNKIFPRMQNEKVLSLCPVENAERAIQTSKLPRVGAIIMPVTSITSLFLIL